VVKEQYEEKGDWGCCNGRKGYVHFTCMSHTVSAAVAEPSLATNSLPASVTVASTVVVLAAPPASTVNVNGGCCSSDGGTVDHTYLRSEKAVAPMVSGAMVNPAPL
jgi:hypothetical protein